MGKLIFNIDDTEFNREASSVSFTVPDDMDIYEFKVMCVRLASALGYTNSSIKKAFGELYTESSSDLEFKEFLKSVNELTGSLLYD
jgi:hypothetical protein